jgi:hypothetical protein
VISLLDENPVDEAAFGATTFSSAASAHRDALVVTFRKAAYGDASAELSSAQL